MSIYVCVKRTKLHSFCNQTLLSRFDVVRFSVGNMSSTSCGWFGEKRDRERVTVCVYERDRERHTSDVETLENASNFSTQFHSTGRHRLGDGTDLDTIRKLIWQIEENVLHSSRSLNSEYFHISWHHILYADIVYDAHRNKAAICFNGDASYEGPIPIRKWNSCHREW